MEEAGWELQDWELLHNTEPGLSIPSDSSETSKDFGGMEEEGIITSNYFSLESDSRYALTVAGNLVGEGSVHSDNPSWVDPNLGFHRKNSSEFWSDSGSDGSGSHKFRDFEGKHEVGVTRIEAIGEFEGGSMSFAGLQSKQEVGFASSDGIGEFEGGNGDFERNGKIGEFEGGDVNKEGGFERWLDSSEGKIVGFGEEDGYSVGKMGSMPGGSLSQVQRYSSMTFEELEEFEGNMADFGKFWADSGGKTLVQGKIEAVKGEGSAAEFVERAGGELGSDKTGKDGEEFSSEPGGDTQVQMTGVEKEGSSDFGAIGNGLESGHGVVEEEGRDGLGCAELVEGGRGETTDETVFESSGGEKKRIVWWKLPFEMLKFCVFRVSPVWSVSVAAAVVGFVILVRRLRKVKKKSRSIPLNITLEDKKVSQFMVRAARLNEAFSVVRRVPIIRPSMPAPGVTPWPVMSLR